MELQTFEKDIKLKHPSWTMNQSRSGIATWIDILTANDVGFTIQITPNDGIGVSRRSTDELDFGGHDEVFDDLVEVLRYLESQGS